MELSARKNEQNLNSDFPFSSLRILPYQIFNGAFNMALDYALAQSARETTVPILRFYGWDPFCLSLGYHQDQNLVDLSCVHSRGYQAVRRPTGGSAIFHSEELTYALIVPRTNLNHHEIYRIFHELLASALNQLGYEVELNYTDDRENYLKENRKRFACFNRPAFAEIQFKQKKVVGSAQKLYKNALLQHGSVLIGDKQNEIIDFLNLDSRAKQNYYERLLNSSIPLKAVNPRFITPQQIAEALLQQLERSLKINLFYQELSQTEKNNAQKFVDQFKIQ